MGSGSVLSMASDLISPMRDEQAKPVHPFFAPKRATNKPSPNIAAPEASDASDASFGEPSSTSEEDPAEKRKSKPVQTRKRRKPAPDTNEPELPRKRGRARRQATARSGQFETLASSTNAADGTNGVLKPSTQTSASAPKKRSSADAQPGQERTHTRKSSQETAQVPIAPSSLPLNEKPDSGPPKKLLKYNPKTGTFGSPPKPRLSAIQEDTTAQVVKKPSSGDGRRKKDSLVVCVQYGKDEDTRTRIGQRIEMLLADEVPMSSSSSTKSTAKVTPKRSTPRRATVNPIKMHPLFQGKRTRASPLSPKFPDHRNGLGSPTLPPRVKQFAVSPASPKGAAVVCPEVPISKAPVFSSTRSGQRNPGALFPHSKYPEWPWKGIVHVRADEEPAPPVDDSMVPPNRKAKGLSVKISAAESIINHLVRQLDIYSAIDAVRCINPEEFAPPPSELRLPSRHFESGRKLQKRISLELMSWARGCGGARAPMAGKSQRAMLSPQLGRLYDSIQSQTSAFDRSECETACWTHKYAPAAAIEILQAGREAFLLKEWLQALEVQSVDTGSPGLDAKEKKKPHGAPRKVKKRKKLDGFVVSSDEEHDVMGELSDTDYEMAPSGKQGVVRKTVIRSGDVKAKGKDGARLTNTVVVSGPHGCGKTAAVYAVAKELGFEIFELNPGSRRNGKDVLEKIGDMTRNHLMKHHGTATTEEGKDGPTGDEVEVKSGKQATMKAFFKPRAPAAPKAKKAAKVIAPVGPVEIKKAAPKSQKQSLILLEEADVLFAEDKQFWSCVIDLITQSKRPFVVTCNEETLVPLQSLDLYAIFRFSAPPVDLAVDRLLLVAANEGHALKREAVEGLYESRQYDMRAATLDLQYWCQIGVGDQKGGLDWFYPRWPKGTDLDEHKDVIRVVSEDTYRLGMGFFGHDVVAGPKPNRTVEEDIIRQTWESWGLDVSNWEDRVGLLDWSENSSQGGRDALMAFEEFTATMSLADVCSRGSLAGFHKELLDPTLPEPSAKMKDDLVLGLASLETPTGTVNDTDPTSLITAITMKTLARSLLLHNGTPMTSPPVLDETTAVHCILHPSSTSEQAISRADFSLALDPIAATDASLFSAATSTFEASVLDGSLRPIALDVAPYIRGILAYESRLQRERRRLGSLVSEGGRAGGARRMRTTRAALSALEGGSRSTTRPERWFRAGVNAVLVMRTGGEGWQDWAAGGDSDSETRPQSRQSVESQLSQQSQQSQQSEPEPARKPRKIRRKTVVEDESADELGSG